MNLLPILLGLVCAAGLTLLIDGLRRRPPGPAPASRRRAFTPSDRPRMAVAVAAGFAAAVLTRGPVAALLPAAGLWTLPR
ncbi:type II secretion protein F, partial [Micromonospora globispora]